MNLKQLDVMKNKKGFVGALDQSGGSSAKTLALYGIPQSEYNGDEEMFNLIHEMRTRVIKSKSFNSDRLVGAILFEDTMNRKIDGVYTADYLWDKKGIVPFLKVDKGLEAEVNDCQLMKPIPTLEATLDVANERHVFGTKMRSVIKRYNEEGIKNIVKQQFEFAKRIIAKGLVPIIEPEVDIHNPEKEKSEALLLKLCQEELAKLNKDELVMFKFTIPTVANLYKPLQEDPRCVRVVALSGGYPREEANRLLALNNGMIASFSRALLEGLNVHQSQEEFDALLKETVETVYEASIK
ncbi:MAG: fructose bisphosphate aldolase [Gammaproteobacteria bacterium]|nr:fructose bisphosphate aldolase [Gammaproteobacteria bacterium]